jgi:hypothetical protein
MVPPRIALAEPACSPDPGWARMLLLEAAGEAKQAAVAGVDALAAYQGGLPAYTSGDRRRNIQL